MQPIDVMAAWVRSFCCSRSIWANPYFHFFRNCYYWPYSSPEQPGSRIGPACRVRRRGWRDWRNPAGRHNGTIGVPVEVKCAGALPDPGFLLTMVLRYRVAERLKKVHPFRALNKSDIRPGIWR
jgi:hypothetical protein